MITKCSATWLDGLPHGLVGCVAEQFLGAAIPGGDDAVEVLADDGIV
jgi:hypothetical protein